MNTRAALGPSNSSYGCIVFSHGHSTFKARYRIDHALIAAVHQIACIVNGENNYYTCMKYIYIYTVIGIEFLIIAQFFFEIINLLKLFIIILLYNTI